MGKHLQAWRGLSREQREALVIEAELRLSTQPTKADLHCHCGSVAAGWKDANDTLRCSECWGLVGDVT